MLRNGLSTSLISGEVKSVLEKHGLAYEPHLEVVGCESILPKG